MSFNCFDRDQLKSAEQNSHMEKNKLASLHVEEKKMLLEVCQRKMFF